MILSWLKKRRRAKLLESPFPNDWTAILETNVAPYRAISTTDQAKLRDCIRVFIAEMNWEGCNGLRVTDEMRVTIAGYACLLLLGMQHDYFSHVSSVLIYPAGFRAPTKKQLAGVVLEGEIALDGEAVYRGTVILSWKEIQADIDQPWDGENLVVHEFAHQLDMLNREIDGTPPLHSRDQAQRWHKIMTTEYHRLIRDTRRGQTSLIREYGATNEAEFFAVVTECFFDAPQELQAEHPELYDLLHEYYGQDPAVWNYDVALG